MTPNTVPRVAPIKSNLERSAHICSHIFGIIGRVVGPIVLDLVTQGAQGVGLDIALLSVNEGRKVFRAGGVFRPYLVVVHGRLGQGLRLLRRQLREKRYERSHARLAGTKGCRLNDATDQERYDLAWDASGEWIHKQLVGDAVVFECAPV